MSGYSQQKVESILEFIRSPTNKLYALFLHFVHEEVYEGVLVTFQSEEPKIHALRGGLLKLMKRLLSFFVRAEVVKRATSDLKLLDFMSPANLKKPEEVNNGDGTRNFIKVYCQFFKRAYFLFIYFLWLVNTECALLHY